MIKNKTLITAHAGCLNKKLDSLEYIKEALKYDIDIIELDIRFDENGVAVLSHDEIDGNKKLVTLKKALTLIGNSKTVNVNFDLKETTYINNMIKDIKDTNMMGRGLITGAEPSQIDRHLLSTVGISYCANGNIDSSKLNEDEYCDEVIKAIIVNKAIGLNLCYKDVTINIIKKLHDNNKKIFVWTVDDAEEIEKMKSLNVDGITTNEVQLVCKKNECRMENLNIANSYK